MWKFLISLVVSVSVSILGFTILFVSYGIAGVFAGLGQALAWAPLYSMLNYVLVTRILVCNRSKSELALDGNHLLKGVLWGIFAFALALLFQLSFAHLKWEGVLLGSGWFFLEGVLMCLGIAFGEEVLFRGFILRYWQRRSSLFTAVLLSSLIFSLIHVPDGRGLLQLTNILLIGVCMALLVILYRSLWVPIGFHFIWNLLDMYVVVIDGHPRQGFLSFISLTTQGQGAEGSVFVTLVFLAFGVYLLVRLYEQGRLVLRNWSTQRIWISVGAIVATLIIVGTSWYSITSQVVVPAVTRLLAYDHEVMFPVYDRASTLVRSPLVWTESQGRGVQLVVVSEQSSQEEQSTINHIKNIAPEAVVKFVEPQALSSLSMGRGDVLLIQIDEVEGNLRADLALLIEQGVQVVSPVALPDNLRDGAIIVGTINERGLISPDNSGIDIYAPSALAVAGAMALYLEVHPNLQPAELRRVFRDNVLPTYEDDKRIGKLDVPTLLSWGIEGSWAVKVLNVPPDVNQGRGITVGIVGEGYQLGSPDLERAVVERQGFCDGPFDSHQSWQGTYAAESVLEIAPAASLVTALVLENDHPGRHRAALDWLVERADVIVIPWSEELNSPEIHQKIDRAVDRGIIIVWPAYKGSNHSVLLTTDIAGGGEILGIDTEYARCGWPPADIGSNVASAAQIGGVAALAKAQNPAISGAYFRELVWETGTQLGNGVIPNVTKLLDTLH